MTARTHDQPADGGDLDRMAQAVDVAWGSRCTVSPRPWVGAVVVPATGDTVFTGATEGRTGPHAEAVALRHAGDLAGGGTLFSTLEPCSHHGRTPPCVDAIIGAGIARVVVGIEDPDPLVAGQGIDRLRAAGIEVEVGVAADLVRAQLLPYLTHRLTGRPSVVLKLAASLDGGTAAPDGTSQWITGPEARADAHRLRAESDAVLVGAGTVRTDDPSLTVRLPELEADPEFRQPLRVVLGAIPPGAKVEPAVSLVGDLDDVLDELGRREVLQVLVEGGASVAAELHRRGLVDRYVFYLAPALFGGDDAVGLFRGPGAPTVDQLWRGDITSVRLLGRDLRVDMVPSTAGPATAGEDV